MTVDEGIFVRPEIGIFLPCSGGERAREYILPSTINSLPGVLTGKKGRKKKTRGGKLTGLLMNMNICLSVNFPSPCLKSHNNGTFFFSKSLCNFSIVQHYSRTKQIQCKQAASGTENLTGSSSSAYKIEDYNTAMKRMMRNPYEYHHDLGMNYTHITDSVIVGSQPQKAEDIDHLKQVENVAYILNLQQDKDIEYWGIDLNSIVKRCQELCIRHMRRPARDFDPNSLRSGLPKAVSSLEWAISEGKGRVYVHCTAGLGRAPAVAIAYLFWFHDMDLKTAYNFLTSKRPCGPNKRAIRGATYDLAKNDLQKEPFDNLLEHAFSGVSDWERKLIQDRVRGLRGS